MTTPIRALEGIFSERADHVALEWPAGAWTYAELLGEAAARAGEWRRLGVVPGDRVLLGPGTRRESLVAVLAGALAGVDLVSVSQKASADEVEYVRTLTRPRLEWPGEGTVPEVSPRVDDSRPVFRDVQVLFFTSGTTSRPKGVSHAFGHLLGNAGAFNRRAGVDGEVRMLHVMPTGYMAGLLNTFLSPLMAGGTVVLGEAFDAATALSFWSVARNHDVNAVWLSPTMAATVAPLCRGASLRAWTAARLRHVFVGTAPLHPSTKAAFRERVGVECLESYGMTECMFASVVPPDLADPGHSVGLLLDGVEVHARGADGTPVAAGVEGDLWIRSPFMMRGYLDGDGGTVLEPPRADGWLDTGDIGTVGADGLLSITGRRKDLIIRGGTNVSPRAVEDRILGFPGVRDVAVVGVPHPFWGEEVVAFVIADGGAPIDPEALTAHCAAGLNRDSVPGRIVSLDEFPRSSNGKIQKHLLRKL